MKSLVRRRSIGTGLRTFVVAPTMDLYINSEAPDTNTAALLFDVIGMRYDVGPGGFGRKALLNFDISAFASHHIISAPLTLTVADASGGGSNRGEFPHLQARRVLPPQTAAATFNTYDGVHAWDQDGGRTEGVDTAVGFVNGPQEMLTENPGDTYFVDVAQLLADALAGALTQLRLMVCADRYTANSNSIIFASSRHATAAWRPSMKVTVS